MDYHSPTKRGSIWRIWDLHVHTPASGFGTSSDYPILIENINNSIAEVIGINDYATIEGYKTIIESGFSINKVLFPIIEFRMNNKLNNKTSTINGGTNINFHIIIDNKVDLQKAELEIASLECFGENGEKTKLGHINKADLSKVTFDYFLTIEALKQTSVLRNKFLVWVPYDEYGGIDNIDPKNDSFFKLGILKYANILGSSNKKQIDFFLSERCLQYIGKNYPCIKGSDSHQIDYPFGKLKDSNSNPTDKFCWIKAEPTFEGLKHIVYEPNHRVKIQEAEPDNKDNRLIIDEVSFISTDDNFTPIPIKFNKNLNVIIGGKSSGKSILLYCIAKTLLTNREILKNENSEYRYQFKNNFEFKVKLLTGVQESITRLDNTPSILPEIKYIPQNHLSKLAEPEENKKGNELRKLVRELLLEDDGCKFKYEQFISRVKSNDEKREIIINNYFLIKDQINAHKENLKSKGNEDALKLNISTNEEKVIKLKESTGLKEEDIRLYNAYNEELTKINTEIDKINTDFWKIVSFNTEAINILNELLMKKSLMMDSLNGDIKVFSNNYYSSIDSALSSVKDYSSSIALNENNVFLNDNFFLQQFKSRNERKEELKKVLEPFIKNEELKKQIVDIEKAIGEDKLKINTINQIKEDIKNQERTLNEEKSRLIFLYKETFEEYEKVIEQLDERTKSLENDNLQIIGKPRFNFPKFRKNMESISDGRKHSYSSYPILFNENLLGTSDFNIDEIIDSLEKIFTSIVETQEYGLKERVDTKQAAKVLLDDYFFDYWDVTYDNDILGKMSTGKASFVILMLIVGLSKSKAPILIDQPEDNLDNRSISKDLVEYLRNKKLERQIILVTHNPNIVVNADAENIIVANQKGQNDRETSSVYLFDYINGAMENTIPYNENESDLLKSMGIKEHITDIVEGGKDAFKKREEKYGFY